MLNIAAVPVVCGNTPCAYIVLAGGCKAVDKYMINKASRKQTLPLRSLKKQLPFAYPIGHGLRLLRLTAEPKKIA